MPKLFIDNREVHTADGSTILEAAAELGIRIPTLCFVHKDAPSASCMVCAVRVNGASRLVPACATKVENGMRVESETPEIREARKAAIELLLSDHLGDCIGPCETACPAHINIPLMLRQIRAGNYRQAIATVRRQIPLPATLGRVCHAPCEKACRRGFIKSGTDVSPVNMPESQAGRLCHTKQDTGAADKPVSIRLLERFAADVDLASEQSFVPDCSPPSRKKVAIIGSGPAGLAAAYSLTMHGHACTIFDKHDRAGGSLRSVPDDTLPAGVLDAEIRLIEKMGVDFRLGCCAGSREIGDRHHFCSHDRHSHSDECLTHGSLQKWLPVPNFLAEYDAVLLATGCSNLHNVFDDWGIRTTAHGIEADRQTHATCKLGVFAAGSMMTGDTMPAIRAIASGNAAAVSIAQYLAGEPLTGAPKPFSVHIGKPLDTEAAEFLAHANPAPRTEPAESTAGFSAEEAAAEAAKCLHCDCRARDDCRLREHAATLGAHSNRWKSERKTIEFDCTHPDVVYEPGKCIACGACIRIAAESREELGLSFIARGFKVKVAVPFGGSLADGLRKAARKCAQACPTGALALKENSTEPK